MLVVNPNMRITINELMKTPWINQDIKNIPETPLYVDHIFDFVEAGQIVNNTLNDGLKNERENADSHQNKNSSSESPNDGGFKLVSVSALNKKRDSKGRRKMTAGKQNETGSSPSSSNVTDRVDPKKVTFGEKLSNFLF